jgi:hypothetical protein
LDKLLTSLDDVVKRIDTLSGRMDTFDKSRDDASRQKRKRRDDEGEGEKGMTSETPSEDDDDNLPEDERNKDGEQPGKSRRVVADRADAQSRHAARLAEIQERADGVAQEFGEKAPPPMSAETERNYRIRLLRRYKHHSPDWKEIDLQSINDAKIFDAAESRIYADARAAGATPEVTDGYLRERVRTDASGRRISEFFGSPRVWMRTFSGHRRYVRSFKT